jgi:hypothetical protein
MNLAPPSQTARRGLILVSKLLQNLANGLEFGNKEPAMASFNPFISDNKEKVEAFFNILAVSTTYEAHRYIYN